MAMKLVSGKVLQAFGGLACRLQGVAEPNCWTDILDMHAPKVRRFLGWLAGWLYTQRGSRERTWYRNWLESMWERGPDDWSTDDLELAALLYLLAEELGWQKGEPK